MCDSVGIIEQGRLLATGSVEQIERQRHQHREITIRVLERAAEAAEQLRNRADVEDLVEDGHQLRLTFHGELKDQAALVAWLIRDGFAVAEVSSHKKSLEDVFLQVTEGLVQ